MERSKAKCCKQRFPPATKPNYTILIIVHRKSILCRSSFSSYINMLHVYSKYSIYEIVFHPSIHFLQENIRVTFPSSQVFRMSFLGSTTMVGCTNRSVRSTFGTSAGPPTSTLPPCASRKAFRMRLAALTSQVGISGSLKGGHGNAGIEGGLR